MSKRLQSNKIARLAAMVAVLFLFSDSWAQSESAADRAMRKAQGMLRQLAAEKKSLELKNSEIASELDQAKTEIGKQQAALAEQQKINQALSENNALLLERVHSDHEKMQDMIEKYRSKQMELDLYRHDHEILKSAVVERNEWMSQCRQKNAELIDAGKDLLRRYDDKSLWDSILSQEPLLGVAKVDQEIQEQEYRFKLEDLEVQATTPDPGPLKIEQTSPPHSSMQGSEKK